MKETYQPIPRRFRPKRFSEVVGQDAIVQTLKNALKRKKSASAYLFSGGRGCGKTTLARVLAKALNCAQIDENQEPCNVCKSCQEITSARGLDVLEIDGASNRGIDDIRQINETVGYATTHGRFKIYIIDEVHMLTKEAFNALLKTLEEPPANVKFFFATTEPHKVPTTIMSRCQRFDLARISEKQITRTLEAICKTLDVEAELEALRMIAATAGGALRDAESLLDQLICFSDGKLTEESVSLALGQLPRETFFALDRAIQAGERKHAFELAEAVFASGCDYAYFYEMLMDHFRIHLQIKIAPELIDARIRDAYAETNSNFSEDVCTRLLDHLVRATSGAGRLPFKKLFIEATLLKLIDSRHGVNLEALVQRLIDLEGRIEGKATLAPDPKPDPITPAPKPNPVKRPLPQEKLNEPKEKKERVRSDAQYDTLMRFAAVELEGTIKKS